MVRRAIEGVFVLAALLAAAALGAARLWPQADTGFYWRAAAIAQMPGAGPPVDFAVFERRVTHNDALACPERLCLKAKSEQLSPVFPVPAAELRRKIGVVVAADTNSAELACAPDCASFGRFVQYSPLFFFPDVIDVRIVEAGANASTLAIYSRSVFGYWDFDDNQDRIARWLAALERITSRR